MKPLDFITIREPKTGRASSLAIHGRNNPGVLYIVGNLEHNAGIVPDSREDADKLIKWLEEWKEANHPCTNRLQLRNDTEAVEFPDTPAGLQQALLFRGNNLAFARRTIRHILQLKPREIPLGVVYQLT